LSVSWGPISIADARWMTEDRDRAMPPGVGRLLAGVPHSGIMEGHGYIDRHLLREGTLMFDSQTNPVFRARLAKSAPSTFGYMLAVGVALVAALFALTVFSGSRVGADPGHDVYLLPDEARYPEGIATDNNGGTFYVSSFSDGSIYRGNLTAEKMEQEPFLSGGGDGRTQAVGMALDDERRLYIAGGFTGKVFIYDTTSRKLVSTFKPESTQRSGFLNDVTVDPKTGDAYITDSFVQTLWRVPADDVTNSSAGGVLDPWLDLRLLIPYVANAFNLNGIVITPGGRYLLTVQSSTGNLFRIDTKSKEVTLVDLGGATLTNGDGLVLNDHTLYIVRNQDELITKVLLAKKFASGQVEKTVPDPTFDFPTTAALVDDRLLVVNSQFDEGGPVPTGEGGEPEIPFTVSSIQAP
jgi:sugar lactone lactonase YvrE